MTPAQEERALNLMSKVSRLEGQMAAALPALSEQAKKIEKLEEEMLKLRGLKGLASSLR